MTESLFRTPHDEGFSESNLNPTEEILDEVGEFPITATDLSNSKGRKGLLLILGGIAILIALLLVFTAGGDEKKPARQPSDSTNIARQDPGAAVASAQQSNPTPQLGSRRLVADQMYSEYASAAEARPSTGLPRNTLVDPNRLDTIPKSQPTLPEDEWTSAPTNPGMLIDFPASPSADSAPISGTPPTTDSSAATPSIDDLFSFLPATTSGSSTTPNTGNTPLSSPTLSSPQSQQTSRVPQPTTSTTAQPQTAPVPEPVYSSIPDPRRSPQPNPAILEQERLRELEAIKNQERQRLRSQRTMMAQRPEFLQQNFSPSQPVAAQSAAIAEAYRSELEQVLGTDQANRFISSLSTLEAAASGPAPYSAPIAAADLSTQQANDFSNVTPGIRANAVTVNEFIQGLEGSGIVEARLTTSLRDRGRTILPAGTRAYGNATATGGQAGREARVTIQFNVFVTPDGQVIEDQLTAFAADPQTLALSVPAKVDSRFLERFVRGTAASIVDLALTANTQSRSVFDHPSPKEMAIMDVRQRTASLLGANIGDEQSVRPNVYLPANTSIILVFGLRG